MDAAACYPRADPEAPIDRREVGRLCDVLSRKGFAVSGRTAVVAVPADRLLTAILEWPPQASGARRDEMARAELAGMYKCDPGRLEVSCWDLPPAAGTDGPAAVMAVACSHDDALELLDAFEGSPLRVAALDAWMCALGRACRPVAGPPSAITALLDIGWSAVRVLVLHRGVIAYERALADAGMERLSKALMRRLGLDQTQADCLLARVRLGPTGPGAADGAAFEAARDIAAGHFLAMAEEVVRAVQCAQHQYPEAPAGTFCLTGGGAATRDLAEFLTGPLAAPVRAVGLTDVAPGVALAAEPHCGASLAPAIGLAQFSED